LNRGLGVLRTQLGQKVPSDVLGQWSRRVFQIAFQIATFGQFHDYGYGIAQILSNKKGRWRLETNSKKKIKFKK